MSHQGVSEMRTIELQFGQEDLETLNVPMDKLFNTIGYLSTWNMTYPKVVIHLNLEDDFIAHYFREDGSYSYTIGAIWHDDHYGFHS
jgi:hypothetical protein